ncbi:hypothetical protein AX17_001264 [Amanita inopinata Kibby_2008]|nr:hypothetical protein AX17_001264 [Amanita inopinata Kibby_2008]
MPVPVPHISKPLVHPVIKKNNSGDHHSNPFQNLTLTLPVSPTGPPPSYGTREQWIESLPTWRRQKPRRIWEDDNIIQQQQQPAAQDFYQGLTVADNATVIKGERAQACIPPLCTMLEPTQPITSEHLSVTPSSAPEMADEMSSDVPQWHWNINTCADTDHITNSQSQKFAVPNTSPASIDTDISIRDAPPYERGAFSPVFEEESPGITSGHGAASSPLEPITPFCDFVERAVTGAQSSGKASGISLAAGDNMMPYSEKDNMHNLRCLRGGHGPPAVEEPKQPVQASVPETLPSSASAYKKLAEPLSEWIANYVWKVCTTGYSLPSGYVNPASIPIARFLDSPPRSLAPSIHSILLSTLLQPSAIFLSLWYIVQLPVYCGSIVLGSDHVKELQFRTALFGEPRTSASVGDSILNLSPMEDNMPFRLVLLGCMLANKWLDDHTFSNKTWHSISNIPVHMLNELEVLALDLLSYNLSVPSDKWTRWMDHILSHHLSSIPPSHAQPISRPSSNPHLIIRKAIEDNIQARVTGLSNGPPQPAFIGLEERKRERLDKEQVVDDIDLDEDGPLREEYLPRRRINGSGPSAPKRKVETCDWVAQSSSESTLPPPAKWSPAGDEPILRDKNRISGNYVAVQAPDLTALPVYSTSYPQVSGLGYQNQSWCSQSGFVTAKPLGYGYDVPMHHQAAYAYPYAPLVPMMHLRTLSFSHEQNNAQVRGHVRAHSQTCFDIRTVGPEVTAVKETGHRWYPANQYPYAHPTYAYHPGVIHQPSWIRT